MKHLHASNPCDVFVSIGKGLNHAGLLIFGVRIFLLDIDSRFLVIKFLVFYNILFLFVVLLHCLEQRHA